MSINIWENHTYPAKEYHFHNTAFTRYVLDFFVKAMLRKNIPHISESMFQGKSIELDDTVYFMHDGKPDFMYIIKVDELKYLVDSSFSVVSDGYHQIVQLHNKMPQTNGYIVARKNEKDNNHPYWGILNNNGKELIPCKYLFISPIICKTVLYHDPDYIGNLSDFREEILLFECCSYPFDKKFTMGYDLYTCDGIAVLKNAPEIRRTEEKIYYKHCDYTGTYIETKVLEKMEISLRALTTIDSFWFPRYIYQVNLDEEYANLQYMGMAEEDRLCLEEHSDEYCAPEFSFPKTLNIKISKDINEFELDKEFMYKFLKKATEDISIYNYIEANDVNFYFKIYFSTQFTQYDAERETENLKDKHPNAIINTLCETIDSILGTNSKKAIEEERRAEWLKKKIQHQSQITLNSKLADCYFGDYQELDYPDMTVKELTALNGEDLFQACGQSEKLFKEVVTVFLSNHICFADYSPNCDIQTYFKKTYDAYEKHKKDIPSQSIDELDLTPRTHNCLARQNIHTIEDLTRYTPDEIKGFRNIGKRELAEILQKLDDLGISLKQE